MMLLRYETFFLSIGCLSRSGLWQSVYYLGHFFLWPGFEARCPYVSLTPEPDRELVVGLVTRHFNEAYDVVLPHGVPDVKFSTKLSCHRLRILCTLNSLLNAPDALFRPIQQRHIVRHRHPISQGSLEKTSDILDPLNCPANQRLREQGSTGSSLSDSRI